MNYERMSYLPMDCPVCGRHRLLADIHPGADSDGPFVRKIICEKCETIWPDHEERTNDASYTS